MYVFDIQNIYTDKKYCLCGCGQVFAEENWGLKLVVEGEISSYTECLELVSQFEKKIAELSQKAVVCLYCGNCCLHGPEISRLEQKYLIEAFPCYKNFYDQLKAGLPCPLGGKSKGPCNFPLEARPLQCRLLFCEANIVGFERLYNFIGQYLGWTQTNFFST